MYILIIIAFSMCIFFLSDMNQLCTLIVEDKLKMRDNKYEHHKYKEDKYRKDCNCLGLTVSWPWRSHFSEYVLMDFLLTSACHRGCYFISRSLIYHVMAK